MNGLENAVKDRLQSVIHDNKRGKMPLGVHIKFCSCSLRYEKGLNEVITSRARAGVARARARVPLPRL